MKDSFSDTVGTEYRLVKAGKFLQGNEFENIDCFWEELLRQKHTDAVREWYPREFPRHRVEITEPFYMAKTPVTVGQFREFEQETDYMRTMYKEGKFHIWNEEDHKWDKEKFEPTLQGNDETPVIGVSWEDTVQFIEWLSKKDGLQYSLPSEAQWEYVARTGTESVFPFLKGNEYWDEELGDFAWYQKNAESNLHIVATRKSNDWGFFDLLGNVWEWCLDGFDEDMYKKLPPETKDPIGPYNSSERSLKGGSFLDYARSLRPADRFGLDKESGSNDIGFRLMIKPSS